VGIWPHWEAELEPIGDDHMGFFELPWDPATHFTDPPDKNKMTIEEIYPGIMNQHPEQVSYLADEWQRAYDFLVSLGDELKGISVTLHDESWGHTDARDAFMKFGPGKMLAVLDDWVAAVNNNVVGLYALVSPLGRIRDRMADMWSNYKSDLAWATTAVDTSVDLDGDYKWNIPYIGDLKYDPEYYHRHWMYQVQKVEDDYNNQARKLAYELAGHYVDLYKKVDYGYGRAFDPPNAVLPDVTIVPTPSMPPVPVPPVPPPVPAPPPVPPPPPVPAPPHPPGTGQPPVPPGPPRPPTILPPQVPVLPGGLGNLPDGLGTPPGPPGGPGTLPVLPVVPGFPPGFGSTGPGGVPGGLLTGPLSPFGRQPGTLPTGPPGGVLNRPGGLGFPPEIPEGGLRTPPAPPPAGRPPGKNLTRPGRNGPPGTGAGMEPPPPTRGRGGPDRNDRNTPPAFGGPHESPFDQPPGPTAPPVLKNRPPERRRKDTDGPPPPTIPGDPTRTPTHVGRDTTPPVLNGPASSPASPPMTPPPPGRGHRTNGSTHHTGPTPPDTEWLNTDDLLAEAGVPIFGGPGTPPTGTAVSGLEEIPPLLRPTSNGTPTPGTRRPTGAGPDLMPPAGNRRRRERDTEHTPEPTTIITDDQAWVVQTPGGGILTNRTDTPTHQPEPTPAIGGS
jgi:hypothetical protein